MIALIASTLLLAVPAPAPAVLRAPELSVSRVQEPPEDERADVKELLKQLDKHAGARGKEDREAVAIIDQLVQLFGDCGPKDRAAIVKGMDKCFKEKRQEDENGVRENQLFLAAATALGEMAPESVEVLLDWIGHKTHRKDVALQRLLIQKLGKLHDEKALKPLIKLLDEPDPQIQGAACEALGYYDGAELDERKMIFEELLKLVMTVKNNVDANPTDPIPRQRYDVIAAPIITSLQRLSGHQEHDPQEWQRWWNKNKKEDWDKDKDA
jgi:HEAT repeat protein